MGEAKTKPAAQEKVSPLTREELVQQLSDLHFQYQKATDSIQRLQAELEKRDFDYTSFFLSMLFKVMEHPEMYKSEFVEWCAESIQSALVSFSSAMAPKEEPKTNGGE